MKTCSLFLFFCLFSISIFAQVVDEPGINEVPYMGDQNWSFTELAGIIQDEFPEAYLDFMEISFVKSGNRIDPGTATFLIPARHFEATLNSKELEARIKGVLAQMGDPGACPEISTGKTETYSWLEWQDKVVTKVIIQFNIGC